MCALYPFLPNWNWPLADPIGHEDNYVNYYRDDQGTLDSVLHFPLSSPNVFEPKHSPSFTTNNVTSSDSNGGVGARKSIAKKLDHNASERDRRRKLNTLFSSLRSLLPTSDQKKKLSIPATVSLVVKYIPELKKEMEKLGKKKEELSRIIQRQNKIDEETKKSDHGDHDQGRIINGSKPLVSASWVNDKEVTVQISTLHETPLSSILLSLEEEFGLLLLTASSYQSFGGRLFCNLHLEMDRSYKLESEVLSQKLLSMYQKNENQTSN